MDSRLCIVVGAGPGVGMAVARRFAREGFTLALVCRRPDARDSYVQEVARLGATAYGYLADPGDAGALRGVFAQIRQELGMADVLVYNPMVRRPQDTPSQVDTEGMVSDFRVNVVGALVCAQQVIPDMRTRGSGAILLTGCGHGLYPSPRFASLSIGKAGLRSLAYSLGEELEPEGIHVALVTIRGQVIPGTHTDPDLIAEAFWQLYLQPVELQEREVVYE